MLLQATGITAAYGDSQALFGVDLSLDKGEVVALIGARRDTRNLCGIAIDYGRRHVAVDC